MRHHAGRLWMMDRIPMPEVASTMKPVLQSLLCCVLLLLADAVWGRDVVVDPHTVDNFVSSLMRKLAVSTAGTLLYLLLLAVLLGGMLSIVLHTLRTGISPMPTSGRVRRQLLSLLPEDLEGTVLELGSGWGTLAFALADRCPRARVVAFELSPVPYAFARLRQRLAPRPNLQLLREDFFRASFSGASAVVCYLFPGAMTRLAPKLSAELAPGTRILSHTFALRGWKPVQTRVVDDLYRTPIYLYEVPGGAGPADTGPGG